MPEDHLPTWNPAKLTTKTAATAWTTQGGGSGASISDSTSAATAAAAMVGVTSRTTRSTFSTIAGGRGMQTTSMPSATAPVVMQVKMVKKAGVVRIRRRLDEGEVVELGEAVLDLAVGDAAAGSQTGGGFDAGDDGAIGRDGIELMPDAGPEREDACREGLAELLLQLGTDIALDLTAEERGVSHTPSLEQVELTQPAQELARGGGVDPRGAAVLCQHRLAVLHELVGRADQGVAAGALRPRRSAAAAVTEHQVMIADPQPVLTPTSAEDRADYRRGGVQIPAEVSEVGMLPVGAALLGPAG